MGAEVWSTTDFITTSGDLDILLDNWLRYIPTLKVDKQRDGILFDNSHIVTGDTFVVVVVVVVVCFIVVVINALL